MTNLGPPVEAQGTNRSSGTSRASEARPESFRGKGCRGKLCRCLWRFLQQPETRNTVYLRVYTKVPQVICSFLVAVFLLILGGAVYSQSTSPVEVVISYGTDDTTKSFQLAEDLTGTVHIHYEIPGVLLNNKDYVSSKDKDSVYTFFSSVSCNNADTLEWAQLRRGSDTSFMNTLAAAGDSLTPCGLVNIALFTDSYRLERDDSPSAWQEVTIDSSDVAWARDGNSFNKLYENNGTIYLDNDRPSWLPPAWLEHWKVWQRTPPGQTVRNLWGVVQGGLAKGSYRVNFVENSPIWEEWGVTEKRFIITGSPSWLGNVGAMRALAGTLFVFGSCELILLITLVVLFFVVKMGPVSTQDSGSPTLLLAVASEPASPRTAASTPAREVVHSMRV